MRAPTEVVSAIDMRTPSLEVQSFQGSALTTHLHLDISRTTPILSLLYPHFICRDSIAKVDPIPSIHDRPQVNEGAARLLQH